MEKAYVMDACALLALINDEDGANYVESFLEKAQVGTINIYMNKINLLEIYYGIFRAEGQLKADEYEMPPIHKSFSVACWAYHH